MVDPKFIDDHIGILIGSLKFFQINLGMPFQNYFVVV